MSVPRAFKRLLGPVLCGAALLAWADGPTYPETPRRPVTDTYHGVSVIENYRWLEDTQSPAVQSWIAQQNALTRAAIDKLADRPAIRQELTELIGKAPVTRREFRYAAGRLFALKKQPPANQPMLVVLTDPLFTASEKVVVDPNRLNAQGTTAIDCLPPLELGGRMSAVAQSSQ
jgi:prolyl oligopeptidase